MANDGTVKIGTELDDSGFKAGLSKLGGVAKSAVAGITAGLAGATAAVGALTRSALDAYASYEQLVGGVETLFGESASKVQEYAANAYKTAGVSANTYMEQATSFSASLLQSLGGDTDAAAEYANQAIMDMSDNANKMGTSIDSIQQTYQSLMRGNYAMLDNLKLGYGGTKSELERLVKDAEKLTGQALDPSKFSDVITAIHAVQTELGITGTTAKEASSTIEGSVNSAKAAWENWLAGLGNEKADMSALTSQLVDAVKTAVKNIIPVVKQILSSLASEISNIIPDNVKDGIKSFVSTLKTISPVIAAVTAGIVAFKTAMMIASIIQGVSTAITAFKAANEAATIAQAALNAVMAVNPFVLIATAVAALVAGIIVLWNTNEGFRDAVISIWEAIKGAFIGAWEAIEAVWSTVADFFTAIWNGIVEELSPITEAIGGAFSAAWSLIQTVWSLAQPFFSNIWEGIKAVFSVVSNVLGGFFSSAWNAIKSVWEAVKPYFEQLWEGIKAVFSVVSDVLGGFFSAAWEAIKGVWNAATGYFENVWKTIEGIFSVVESVLKGDFEGAWEAIKGVLSGWGDYFRGLYDTLVNVFSNVWDAFSSIGSNIVDGIKSGISNAWGSLTSWVSDKFNALVSSVKSGLGIASPSKVFASIGGYMAEGVGVGWEDEFDKIKSDINKSLEFNSAVKASIPIVRMATNSMVPRSVSSANYSVQQQANASNFGNSSLIAELRSIKTAIEEGKVMMVDRQVLGRITSTAIRNNSRALGVENY